MFLASNTNADKANATDNFKRLGGLRRADVGSSYEVGPNLAKTGEAFLDPELEQYFNKEMIQLLRGARTTWM